MIANPNIHSAAVDTPIEFKHALEQSQDVKEKVEACADDLGSANHFVKKKIAAGATALPATTILAAGEKVEGEVQECADDLHEVNETLARGIDDLKRIELALVKSRQDLTDTEARLVISQEKEKKSHLRALHDHTTGLPNRALFDDRLTYAIALADRHNWTLAVMFLDLDRFKNINDTHGHAAGDSVLKEVARRLLTRLRDEDTVCCRNGGDEFLYLLIDPRGPENVARVTEVVLKNIGQPIAIGDQQLIIGASIGIAVYPIDGTTGDELIRKADTAMYRAKKLKSGHAFFDTSEVAPVTV